MSEVTIRDVLIALIGLVAGLVGGWSLRVRVERNSNVRASQPVQSGNVVGGDMAGRDIRKKQ